MFFASVLFSTLLMDEDYQDLIFSLILPSYPRTKALAKLILCVGELRRGEGGGGCGPLIPPT